MITDFIGSVPRPIKKVQIKFDICKYKNRFEVFLIKYLVVKVDIQLILFIYCGFYFLLFIVFLCLVLHIFCTKLLLVPHGTVNFHCPESSIP